MVRWRLGLGLTLLVLIAGLGCGDHTNNGTANLRVMLASPDAPRMNVIIDGDSLATNLNYGSNTGYLSVKSGSPHVQVVAASGSPSLFDKPVSIADNGKQTLVLAGPVASVSPVTLTDGGTTTTAGSGYVRALNASSTMGPADIYIVPPGSSLAGVTPVSSALAFTKDSGYQLVVAGAYEVFFTSPGTTNVLLSTGPLSLTANQNQTIVALDGASGSFTFSQLTD